MMDMCLTLPEAGTNESSVDMCKKCGKGATFPELYKKGEPVVIAPGYELSRTKSNVAVCLCDEFFNRVQASKSLFSRPPSENQTEQLVTDLQKQITQLVQLLEQESLKQMSIQIKFQNESEEASLKMQREHEQQLRKLAEEHALEIEELQNSFANLLEEEKEKSRKKYSDMKAEYENLQAAFISFKESFVDEMNAKWAQREKELREKYENEMRRELALQKNSMQHRCDEEKQLITDNYEEQIALILDKHNKDRETASKQYSSIMGMIVELKKAKEKIEILQEQLNQKMEEGKNQAQYVNLLETQLAADRAKLTEIEGTYKTNLYEMKRQFVVSIKTLEDQNLDLKQLFAIKAEELCALKVAIEERERQDDIARRMNLQQKFGQAYQAITPRSPEVKQEETPVIPERDIESPEG